MLAVFAVSPCLLFAGPVNNSRTSVEPPLERYEFSQIEMGVPFTLVLYAADEDAANAAAAAAFRRIKQLNDILSDYDPDSEAMRLCRLSGPEQPVEVSRELFHVLSRSIEVSRLSDGAFNVTVGPAVKLWRKARRRHELPPPDALADALKRVGFEAIQLNPEHRTVKLKKSEMLLDFGGIAKGYAGDEALRVLERHGITRALLAGSGDIVVADPPPGRTGWRIEVAALLPPEGRRRPTEAATLPQPLPKREGSVADAAGPQFLLLSNAAVSTSGDAYQFVEIDGKRYSHIVDPQTGLGLTTPMSVTVIAPDGTKADSWASAVSVLGPERGLKIVESLDGVSAFVALVREGELQMVQSRSFGEYVEPVEAERP